MAFETVDLLALQVGERADRFLGVDRRIGKGPEAEQLDLGELAGGHAFFEDFPERDGRFVGVLVSNGKRRDVLLLEACRRSSAVRVQPISATPSTTRS